MKIVPVNPEAPHPIPLLVWRGEGEDIGRSRLALLRGRGSATAFIERQLRCVATFYFALVAGFFKNFVNTNSTISCAAGILAAIPISQ